ncbi:MAG: photosystem II stability/assembly factor-like uncharacterized protein [Candidatus Krumholzibacteriia bacterium]|jgi:photosystem II stability/assembly factor-like uncharacterized protein
MVAAKVTSLEKKYLGRQLLFALMCVVFVVSCVKFSASTALAQTPDAACASDSLYLISPDDLDLSLNLSGKPGLTVSWPNLDATNATCFGLGGTDELAFNVTSSGGFGDKVDRLFRFATPDSGDIGSDDPKNIVFEWQNQGDGANGNMAGLINLSNNGGLWEYGALGSQWAQFNNGLPMTWNRTNIVAMDVGSGDFKVAAFTSGVSLESASTGVYIYNGTSWQRIAADLFNKGILVTKIVVSPNDNNTFAIGTGQVGLYVTTDGGNTFTQWTTELDPGALVLPGTFRVKALNWESSRLLVFMPNWGLFISSDNATSFVRSDILVQDNLDDPVEMVLPTIESFSVDPSNEDHIVAGLLFHGAFETDDGGQTWNNLYGDLVVPAPESPGAWSTSAGDVLIDSANPLIIVMGVLQKGIFQTNDGGETWVSVDNDAGVQPINRGNLSRFSLINRRGRPGEMLAMEDGWNLLHSFDSGATWSLFAEQPALPTGLEVISRRDNSGDFMVATNGGGIYVTGTTLLLSDTFSSGTSTELRDLDLGLEIRFDQGVVQPDDTFDLVAQTFQGWAVWRGPSHDRSQMKLLGLYDRVNPEDCFEGYCGDNSLEIVPLCYRAKRAACFDLSNPDTVRFFDEEVYNGFSYFYAVTSFDYGNTALTTPQNNTNQMLFSPRFTGDELSLFNGAGNRTLIDVNQPAAVASGGEEIYAYPNPIRAGAGLPRSQGETVVFTNLPDGSRVRVFTTAGDDVINLGPDNQTGGQMYWRTVNRNGESVSAGVYLYKVEMPEREDYWGRIVVIR